MALPEVSLAFVAACFLAVVLPRVASAQKITIDGRFSAAQTLTGPNYDIGANLGKQVGSNLFHSFGQFSLVRGDTAAFSGPATVNNVIGRVTGGIRSDIDGTIKSTIAGADLFLINPSGIVFGPNATVNVSGSFHASTADYIKMSDGAKFQATNPDGSTLSAAPPAAFGFLNASPPAISVNGSTLGPVAGTLGLVGGPVSISGATLSAPAGTIHVTSAAGTGEVPVDPRNAAAQTVSNFGPVDIKDGSKLDVSDRKNLASGGSVFIRSGALTIDASEINADNYGSGSGGSITIVAGQLALHNGANVLAQSFGTGAGGVVDVKVDGPLTIDSGASLGTVAYARGRAGDVSVTVAGPVTIDMSVGADSSTLNGIGSATLGSGNAGNVTVNAGTLAIVNHGAIASLTGGAGRSGDVSVNVSGILDIVGNSKTPNPPTAIAADAVMGSTGNAGKVSVTAGTLSILNNGEISSSSLPSASGSAGTVTVTVSERLTIDGTGANQDSAFTGIAAKANPSSAGNAGTITVTAETLSIANNGEISSSASASGNAGNIMITVSDRLTIDGIGESALTGIASQANPNSTGNAGSVTVNAGSLSIVNNGVISSRTFGLGDAESVSVSVEGGLLIDGTMARFPTGIDSSAKGPRSGPGGPVTVKANTLTIEGGAQIASSTAGSGKGGDVNVIVASDIVLPDPGPQITAQSTGSGDAGSITVSAVRLLMNNGAAISTAAETANGGNITLKVSDLVYLLSSKITASVNVETGNGGNITIDPQLVVLNHSSIIAQAAEGHGGNITINAGAFIPSADSIVDASSQTGISGTVVITGPRVDVNGALVVLSSELRGRAAVLREACAARGDRPISSLVEAGRGGLPQDPEATLPALFIADRDFNPNPQAGIEKTEASSTPLQTTVRLTMRCG